MCKLIFKKHFKTSLSLASPLILADLVLLTQNTESNSGLHVFSKKVVDLFRHQKEDLKTSKRMIFEKISKYFPYDQPYYLMPS